MDDQNPMNTEDNKPEEGATPMESTPAEGGDTTPTEGGEESKPAEGGDATPAEGGESQSM